MPSFPASASENEPLRLGARREELLRALFVMDPLERIGLTTDSTFAMMAEATARGHDVWMAEASALALRDGRTVAWARQAPAFRDPLRFEPGPPSTLELASCDVVFMRKDPPIDAAYVLATHLLEGAGTLVVNDPVSLRALNEKLWVATNWPHLQPETLATSRREAIVAFAEEMGTPIVLKPWNGNGGRGIVVTSASDRNLPALIDLLTTEGREAIIAQRYLPEVADGDRRILLFDGEAMGVVNRIPGVSDHRANLHVGGRAAAADLRPVDLAICAEIGPSLREHGLLFVGIDVIGDRLTEINLTSPTGFQEYARLTGVHLERDLLDRVERRVGSR